MLPPSGTAHEANRVAADRPIGMKGSCIGVRCPKFAGPVLSYHTSTKASRVRQHPPLVTHDRTRLLCAMDATGNVLTPKHRKIYQIEIFKVDGSREEGCGVGGWRGR
ncbi:hypothetical protein RF11_01527 [Thelohanellus kitauei]|uniref:Uncharacterized protein n=1 Tax=Thelohanellus kitauei TaxID=669202 RepID=A0A0C2JI17_THEKT|nr:hypothetical protein RF11_01527 [Thelohanellus kitauei]